MRRILIVASAILLGGCTTTQIVTSGEAAAVAPMLSVERFLQATNNRDLHGMALLFGTERGASIETGGTFGCAFKKLGSWIGIGDRCETLQEVELRMDAISQILEHEDYTVVSEESVAGRVHPTSRIGVNLQIDGRTVEDVPFIVVRTGKGRWLIEQIGLDRITGRR
jgi:hypothetical protein